MPAGKPYTFLYCVTWVPRYKIQSNMEIGLDVWYNFLIGSKAGNAAKPYIPTG